MHPAQPAGGVGPLGNDLLEGLPDEDRERRRRDRVAKKQQFGAGLADQDAYDDDLRANGGVQRRQTNDSLVGDLEDPDRALYGGAPRNATTTQQQPSRSDSFGLGSKKKKATGRSKKSERYGLAEDHRDLSSSSNSNAAAFAPSGGAGYGKTANSIAQRKQKESSASNFSSNNPYASNGNGGGGGGASSGRDRDARRTTSNGDDE